MEFKKHVLKNGLRVIFVPMKGAETVAVQILVEAGSKYENKKNNGISHFIEHMMFKGTKKRPSTKIIAELFDSVGGEYNAFTGKEQTGYWVKVPTKHFEMALDVVSDMYLNPLLKQEEINRERGVILQEVAMYQDTPMRYVWDVFENLLYGDQPAGWDIIGTKENIKKVNRKDFVDYINKMYLPKSTVVSIAGNFDEEKALAFLEKNFNKSNEKQRKIQKKKVLEKQSTPKIKLFNKDTDQTHLIIGLRGPNIFSADRYVAVVLGSVLGGGMSSRSFINIRERHGLAYYINASTDMTTDTGYFFFSAGVEHDNLEKAIKLILKEIRKVRDKKISPKELKKAKEYLKGKLLMSLESTNAVASFFGEQEFHRKKIILPGELFEKIDSVTSMDIQKLVRTIAVNSRLNLAIVGPQKDSEKIQKIFTLA